jgi:serine/threonine protein kinase
MNETSDTVEAELVLMDTEKINEEDSVTSQSNKSEEDNYSDSDHVVLLEDDSCTHVETDTHNHTHTDTYFFVGMNNLTGKLMAVKSLHIPISSPNEIMEDLQHEIDLMQSFKHQNIVHYIGAEMNLSKQTLYIFQEWVTGGSITSLLNKFGPFPTAVVRSYFRQILCGLKYLHSNRILHHDIKGGNVLVNDEGVVKLADFGASKKLHVTKNGNDLKLFVDNSCIIIRFMNESFVQTEEIKDFCTALDMLPRVFNFMSMTYIKDTPTNKYDVSKIAVFEQQFKTIYTCGRITFLREDEPFYFHCMRFYLPRITHETFNKHSLGLGIFNIQGFDHHNKESKYYLQKYSTFNRERVIKT